MMDISMLIAPSVFVIVEAVKRMEVLEKRWFPITALGLGIVLGAIFAIIEPTKAVTHVVNGLLYGASSAGIYDAGASAIAK